MQPDNTVIIILLLFGGICLIISARLQAKWRDERQSAERASLPIIKRGPEMEDEQTDVEVELAGILDRLGCEMLAASRRLRTAPYSEVEDFLRRARRTLEQVDIAAATMKSGCFNSALGMLRLIDVPEIDFTDADEDQMPSVSDFFGTGS